MLKISSIQTNTLSDRLIMHCRSRSKVQSKVQSASSSGTEWSQGDERAEVNSESIVYITSGE